MSIKAFDSCEINHNTEEIYDNSASTSLFVVDRDGNILISNTFTALTLGMSLEELLKSNVNDLVKKGFYNHSFVMDAFQRKELVIGKIKTRTGVSILVNSTPLFDENGEVNLVVSSSIPNQGLNFAEEDDSKTNTQEKLHVKTKMINKNYKDIVVAESTAMKQILRACDQIAPSDCKVLLFGESGTGKEVLSKYIHNQSKRKDQPFISVNCAAIPETLFESELFGYEKGAFTGANAQKKGILELASGGTLFLDEISEMPLDLQAKLLRVLENPEIRRVGGTTSFMVNFRLVAATNRDLAKMVEEGTFRRDLYYRINVIPIHIPPLRKRQQDIIGLSSKFLAEYNEKYSKNAKLNSSQLNYLLHYNWPGNIRELKNYIERLVVIDEGFDDANQVNGQNDIFIDLNVLDASPKEHWPTLKEFLQEAEEMYIMKVLDACDGKKSEAADMLGIYRTVLYRKLKGFEVKDMDHVAGE